MRDTRLNDDELPASLETIANELRAVRLTASCPARDELLFRCGQASGRAATAAPRRGRQVIVSCGLLMAFGLGVLSQGIPPWAENSSPDRTQPIVHSNEAGKHTHSKSDAELASELFVGTPPQRAEPLTAKYAATGSSPARTWRIGHARHWTSNLK